MLAVPPISISGIWCEATFRMRGGSNASWYAMWTLTFVCGDPDMSEAVTVTSDPSVPRDAEVSRLMPSILGVDRIKQQDAGRGPQLIRGSGSADMMMNGEDDSGGYGVQQRGGRLEIERLHSGVVVEPGHHLHVSHMGVL